MLFCPTEAAIKNLQHEGIKGSENGKVDADNKAVFLSGDVMYDASIYYRKKLSEKAVGDSIKNVLHERFYLTTLHRAENTDDPGRLASIVKAINWFKDMSAVLPLHPRTKKILSQQGMTFEKHVHVIDPVGYFDMLLLESLCDFVVTDSGGVQKEAYFFKKPCITLRDSTEWVELCEHGWNTLVGADTEKILSALRSMPKFGDNFLLYGDGRSGQLILDTILNIL